MTGRVRVSTVALTVVFTGVLALYVQVRPPPVAVAGTGTVEKSVVPTSPPVRTAPRTSEPTAAPTSTPVRTPSAVPEVLPTSDGARPRPTPETPPPSTSGSVPG